METESDGEMITREINNLHLDAKDNYDHAARALARWMVSGLKQDLGAALHLILEVNAAKQKIEVLERLRNNLVKS